MKNTTMMLAVIIASMVCVVSDVVVKVATNCESKLHGSGNGHSRRTMPPIDMGNDLGEGRNRRLPHRGT